MSIDDDHWGMYEGQCAGCEVWGQIDELGLCENCAAKLDRDLIQHYGKTLELMAPPDKAQKKRESRKRPKQGHYCHVCRRHRANEKFSGKGHARHVCKDCERERRHKRRQKSGDALS